MTIRHAVSLAKPYRRAVEVTVEADLPEGAGPQDVTFPVWTPGSYLVREHARHVHDLRALADGRPVAAPKVAKNVYRVACGGARRLTLHYEVYAHELTVRTSHVDPGHAFLNPIGLVPLLPGREGERQEFELRDVPAGWGVACGLPEVAPNLFAAAGYDELVDSPLECGPHARPEERRRYEVRGVPHEIVFWGRSPLDKDRFTADCAKITEAQAAMFGGLPYERYLFIVLASDAARGGLEHRASSALLFTRGSLSRPKGYEDFLGLVSHELFHAWNVKRIRPAAFTPYDLTRENHTRLLWAFEGLTSYFEDIFLVRAGLMSRGRYLELLGERLTELERNPGRRRHAVEEASYDAWIRYYRQDENWNNSSTSYYLKGALVGTLFDLEIRRRTQGERSLDDAMRLLFQEFAQHGRGVPEDGVEAAIERVAGSSMKELFDLALRSTDELPFQGPLAAHGLAITRRVAMGAEDRGGPAPAAPPLRCDLGLATRAEGDRVRVATVRRDSAAEAAGVCPGDELVAVDGLRAEPSGVFQRLHDRAAGDRLELVLFRRDELLTVAVTARPPREDALQVVEDSAAPPAARELLACWMGPA